MTWVWDASIFCCGTSGPKIFFPVWSYGHSIINKWNHIGPPSSCHTFHTHFLCEKFSDALLSQNAFNKITTHKIVHFKSIFILILWFILIVFTKLWTFVLILHWWKCEKWRILSPSFVYTKWISSFSEQNHENKNSISINIIIL